MPQRLNSALIERDIFRVWGRRFGSEVVLISSTKCLLEGKYHPGLFVFGFVFVLGCRDKGATPHDATDLV
jgi:hypothetical protein